MKKKPKYLDTSAKPVLGLSKKSMILGVVAVLLLIVLGISLWLFIDNKPEVENTTPSVTTEPKTEPTEESTEETTEEPTEETTEPEETEPVMMEHMAELYAQNPDIVGWIRIDGTKLDYPVMFTPDDEEKYIHMDFEEKMDFAGLPFIDKDCSLDPESDNLILYGHNMNNGTGFRTIIGYDKQKFWEEHPTIYFSTLYEERTYEVLAAFYDRVYKKTDTCFKFYQFIEPETEEEFNEAIAYYKEHSEIDTGVTAEYGDSLITLVTCAYHTANGRFVVVAREVTETPEVTGTPEVTEITEQTE